MLALRMRDSNETAMSLAIRFLELELMRLKSHLAPVAKIKKERESTKQIA